MRSLRLVDSVIIGFAILAVFTVMRCSIESEVKIPDTELVKCLEKKILSGKIYQEDGQHLFSSNVRWVDDSTLVINIVTDSYSDNLESIAYLTILDQEIELTEQESDRIVEITNKKRDKLDRIKESIEKKRQDKKQYSLRVQLLKNCK